MLRLMKLVHSKKELAKVRNKLDQKMVGGCSLWLVAFLFVWLKAKAAAEETIIFPSVTHFHHSTVTSSSRMMEIYGVVQALSRHRQ